MNGDNRPMGKIEFADVYAQHKNSVWRLVARYVFNREDREDLFQEVFLRIHTALPNFRGEAKLETWLYRITINTSMNYVNRQNRSQKLKQFLANLRIIEELEAPEIDELSLPLSKLNTQQRMIVLLSDVEDRSLEEIASMTGLPLGTVKSNLHRAREIVKKEVIKDGSICELYPEIETD